MAMEIAKSFVVKAPVDEVWRFLTDPARVAACLPGAAITGAIDDKTYGGTITVKVGPVAASYKGTMTFSRLDAAARTAEIVAKGQDVRGKGGADMRMTSRLVERAPRETEVDITSEVNVMGILAQFGRGMIQDVSDQMFDKFVAAARAQLETSDPEVAQAGDPEGSHHNSQGDAEASRYVQREHAVPAAATAPIDVLSLGSAVVGRAAARTARGPLFWIVLVVIVLAVYWLWPR